MDGWGLLHSLTTDLLRSVLGSASTEKGAEAQAGKTESWTFVSTLMTEHSKANLIGQRLHTMLMFAWLQSHWSATAHNANVCMAAHILQKTGHNGWDK